MRGLLNSLASTAVLGAVLSISGCGLSDFEELNTNPNASDQPILSNILTGAIVWIAPQRVILENRVGDSYVQYLLGGDKPYEDADNDYDNIYQNPLANLQFNIDYNTNPETRELARQYGSNGNQIAVAKILRSYFSIVLTDRFGDVPYTSALNSGLNGDDVIFNPQFDRQQDIYLGGNGIFETLKSALVDMDGGKAPAGDILFDGDMVMWAKFANSLHLIVALRLSEVDEATAKIEFVSALNAENGVISSNLENIEYQYLNYDPYENPRYNPIFQPAISDVLVNYMSMDSIKNTFTLEPGKMNLISDPRLPVYMQPTLNSGGTDYAGKPYHWTLDQWSQIEDGRSMVSRLGQYFTRKDLAYPIYTYSHILFCRAEAALMGWTTEIAEDMYYQAIFASLEQYGVADDYDLYIQNSEVKWDPDRALEQISNQKWVALFIDGYEVWNHWRRTGFPDLVPFQGSSNSKDIPTRLMYPASERDLNSENYQEAIDRQNFNGINDMNGKVWWDVD